MFEKLDFKNRYSWMLFGIHFLAYCLLPILLLNGSWCHFVALLGMHALLATNMSVTFHRYLSHKSFEFKWPVVRKACLLLAHLTAFSSGITWTAIHREHHRFVDTDKDPHHCFGWRDAIRIHFLFYWIQPKVKYAADLWRNPETQWLHKHYFKLNYAWLAILMLIDPLWCAALYLIPSLMVYHGSSFVNSLSHKFGYRNHASKDASTNNVFVGLVTYGEWHNNHHAHAELAQYGGQKWWEFDLGYLFIKLVGKNIK